MIFLELEELLYVAERALGFSPEVRDAGLLESAARNHALVDGNKRLALAGIIAFNGMNGLRLTLTNDEAYDLVIGIASGSLDDVAAIAPAFERSTAAR